MIADEDLHRHAVENLDQADALLFGRVTYEMMEAAFLDMQHGDSTQRAKIVAWEKSYMAPFRAASMARVHRVGRRTRRPYRQMQRSPSRPDLPVPRSAGLLH
jgi:hypothetical protein